MQEFPSFWYESNSIWGPVDSMDRLHLVYSYVLKYHNYINTPDNFLDKSIEANDKKLNFGTRREHTGNKTLREYLREHNLLDEFLVLTQ